MIDGKSHTEILAMTNSQRRRWYQGLDFVDRGWAMEIVAAAGQAKISAAWTSERRGAMNGRNNPNYGKSRSDESRAKIRGENNPNYDKSPSEETRSKQSMVMSGKNNPRFNNWSSREPYCHLWTEEVREAIRNRDERRCQLCGKSELLNGQRLSVHHIDGDKMQGCGKRWFLVALCHSCNSRPDTLEKEFLIVSNLRCQHVLTA